MSPERPRPDQGDPGPCPALAHENDHITHRLQHKIVTIITEIGSNFPKISFMDLQSRQNTFWVLRHGRSKANAAGVIVSTLENGTLPEWGLTEEGSNQARNAGASLRDALASASAPAPAPPGGCRFSLQPDPGDGAMRGRRGRSAALARDL